MSLSLSENSADREATTASPDKAADRYQKLFNGQPTGLVLLGVDRRIQMANPAAVTLLLGGSENELVGSSFLDLVAGGHREQEQQRLERHWTDAALTLVRELEFARTPLRAVGPHGHGGPVDDSFGRDSVAMLAHSSSVRDDTGRTTGVLLRLESIEARRRAEIALQESQSAFDGIVTTDAAGSVVSWNDGAQRLLGYTRQDIVGQTLQRVIPPALYSAHRNGIKAVGAGRTPRLLDTVTEVEALHRDGRTIPVELSLSRWFEGTELHYTAVLRDISERQFAEKRHDWSLVHDSISGLPNLQAWRTMSLAHTNPPQDEPNINTSNPGGSGKTGQGVVAAVKLVGLADVLSEAGPNAVAEILADLGRRLAEAQQTSGIRFFHLAEDRLAAIPSDDQPSSQSSNAVHNWATTVAGICEGPFTLGQESVELDCRVSVVHSTNTAHSPDVLLRYATAALITTPRRIHVADVSAQQSSTLTTLRLPSELRAALQRDELELHYQPIVDSAAVTETVNRTERPLSSTSPDPSTGSALSPPRPVRFEALLRWRRVNVLVSPDEFIPAAERSSVIVPLTQWVITTAARQRDTWSAERNVDATISVNIAPALFQMTDLPSLVQRAIDGTNCPPQRMKLEITESALLDDPANTIRVIERLREQGFPISIDDFGTGFTSLRALRELPIDEIKLDKMFITNITRSRPDRAIANALAQLANDLNIDTVAEGVENIETAVLLRDLRFRRQQGFLYSRPLTPDAPAILPFLTQ